MRAKLLVLSLITSMSFLGAIGNNPSKEEVINALPNGAICELIALAKEKFPNEMAELLSTMGSSSRERKKATTKLMALVREAFPDKYDSILRATRENLNI